jgi:adenylate cyclase
MVDRRVTVLLAADVADCGALTEDDLRAVVDLKCAARQLIIGYSGSFKDTAEGEILAEFIGQFNAVKCAIMIQKLMRARNAYTESGRPIEFRIGLTHRDVLSFTYEAKSSAHNATEGPRAKALEPLDVTRARARHAKPFNDDTIDGHAFKVAASLVDLCEPGGICISDKLYNAIKGRFDVEYQDIGEQELHNVPNPVHVFRIKLARHRTQSRNPRWVVAILGVLGMAIVLGSTLMWWLNSTP